MKFFNGILVVRALISEKIYPINPIVLIASVALDIRSFFTQSISVNLL